jgi:hypothetical protein
MMPRMPRKDLEGRREYNRTYQREWAQRNRHRLAGYRQRKKEEVRGIIAEAKSGGCIRCGEADPPCLDFHHLRDKDSVVAGLACAGWSVERVRREIAKCVVLCANCHRKFHAGRFAL